ncbi:hypothetical protein [Hyphomonas sp.]|uniref:hypothetical protein n=1 Tax=Hyphomonas sp. TaxID=87 RepID=UPI0025B9D94C|nr:hypothetical protein [Hyphomonas sp.]MBI1399618.1 hypothetical protein [Hyphomonas sp.]
MQARRKKLAILHDKGTPRGDRLHMVVQIADHLREMGVEVIDLHGTGYFEPADAVFVHVDRSVVSPKLQRFARRFPVQINAHAGDIRKRTFVDGLLEPGDSYPAPVILKSDLNYGGAPELVNRSLLKRMTDRLTRLATRPPPRLITQKSDYRIFPTLADVPPGYFTPDNIVQKLMLEKAGEKNMLREYIFLGRLHYENIEQSRSEIITEDEHVSCLPFEPHPRLVNMRRRLNLDYGKIDYVMIDGEPFIFDANKTLGLGAYGETEYFGEDFRAMLKAFAEEIVLMLNNSQTCGNAPTGSPAGGSKSKARSSRFPHAARSAATA